MLTEVSTKIPVQNGQGGQARGPRALGPIINVLSS